MLKLYNTLTRSVEDFQPISSPHIGIYSCGPTVYDYQHIGHMRRYVGDDILVRALTYNGYDVKHVMNITDVGHLTSDADTGEDKMEKGAKKFGMSVWDIAKKFEKQFFESLTLLGIKNPDIVIHATDAIADQIDLIQILEEKGFTYTISDGVYFDTTKFPDYFKLSRQNPQELKAGARVEMAKGKRNITDFALWKFSPNPLAGGEKRQMEWESPWGVGFPGWHIECSAMSMKNLGPTFDMHTGGIDHINIHHTNEIAQSEAATGRKFVNYWVHHAFLHVQGQKMSKSIGNIYTVQDVMKKGFSPLSLRYLYLQTHYRQEMNFTWEALEASQRALSRLYEEVTKWEKLTDKKRPGCEEFEKRFFDAVNDDLNMPQALAVVWELVKSDYPSRAKAESLFTFDKILELDIWQVHEKGFVKPEEKIPSEIMEFVTERNSLRKQKKFILADQIRHKIIKLGYEIEDKKDGKVIVKSIAAEERTY